MARPMTDEEVIQTLIQDRFADFVGKEREYESYVEECLPEIFEHLGLPEIRVVVRQKQIKVLDFMCRIDLLVQHVDDSMSVIEVKCTNPKHPSTSPFEQCSAIGQLLLYRSVIRAVYGHDPRLFLVDNKIHLRTRIAYGDMNLPITLMEIQDNRVFVPYVGW